MYRQHLPVASPPWGHWSENILFSVCIKPADVWHFSVRQKQKQNHFCYFKAVTLSTHLGQISFAVTPGNSPTYGIKNIESAERVLGACKSSANHRCFPDSLYNNKEISAFRAFSVKLRQSSGSAAPRTCRSASRNKRQSVSCTDPARWFVRCLCHNWVTYLSSCRKLLFFL